MKLILFFVLINIGYAIRINGSKHLAFLNSSMIFRYINRDSQFNIKSKDFDTEMMDGYLSDSDSSEQTPLFNEEELKMINEYVDNLKSGVYGIDQQKEFEKIRKEELEKIIKEKPPNVKELLDFKDEKLDSQLKEVFDISNIPSGERNSFDWDDLEKKINEEGKEGLNIEDLKSLVHSMYREKGLLNDPFKVLEIEGLKLNWRQSLETIEMWFVVDSKCKRKDYEIKFLPSRLTIMKENKVILEKELEGKVDCDGCFWTMYKNPSTETRYININLTKRKPKYIKMWDEPFK